MLLFAALLLPAARYCIGCRPARNTAQALQQVVLLLLLESDNGINKHVLTPPCSVHAPPVWPSRVTLIDVTAAMRTLSAVVTNVESY